MDPHKAIDYIIQNSVKYAQAKANRLYLEEFRKSKKALLMKDALARGYEAVNAQEREAYSDPDYLEILRGIKEATAEEEEIRWKMEAAKMRIEVWRSEQATARSQVSVTL
jgi:hypothetical protein